MRSIDIRTAALSPFILALCACGQPVSDPTTEELAPQIPSSSVANPAPPAPALGSDQSYSVDDPTGELPTSMTTPGPVPLAYRHVWAIDAADCSGQPGLTRIAIAPGAVKFYEGRSAILSATENASGLTLNVEHTAEGETSTQTHVLALDAGGETLTYTRNGEVFLYQLCE